MKMLHVLRVTVLMSISIYSGTSFSYDVEMKENIVIKDGSISVLNSGEVIKLNKLNQLSLDIINDFVQNLCKSKIKPKSVEVKVDLGVAKAQIKGDVLCD